MKLTSQNLIKLWGDIDYKDGGFLHINIQHQIEWHIGYQSTSQRTLLLVCNSDIDNIESSKSILVSRRRRETDNRNTLTFELLHNAQQDVFASLCSDIIEHSRIATDEEEALKLIINRYRQWTRLLESQKNGVMDEHVRKGLLGELLFMEQYFESCDSELYVIQGWSGADAADQDFMYSEGWYEVKSIGLSASNVTISSLEQLNCKDEGELVIMRIDKVAPSRSDAFSLNDVVYRISDRLSSNIDAFELFKQKLTSYGYIDLQEYSEIKYYYYKMQRYSVNETFPCITSNIVPTAITSLSYTLSLPALIDWLKG